jgi:PLP dependent protein
MPTLITEQLFQLKKRIIAAEIQFQRLANSVQLIAISKSQDILSIKEAIAAGQALFGENYVQESLDKIIQLSDYAVEWHFVGKIQNANSG